MSFSYLNCVLENRRRMPVYYSCPGCGRDKTYQRYVCGKTGVPVTNDVGRCKSKSCGYDYHPYHYFTENRSFPSHISDPSFIPNDLFLKSLNRYNENNLFLYLKKQFGEHEANETMKRYSVGTSMVCPGASVLWRIDKQDRKREGRITLFDKDTCNDGGYWNSKGWVSKLVKTERFNAVSCLFGENLLRKEPNKHVAIVYTERAAIIASCLYPGYLWLAMRGGYEAPGINDMLALSGRFVTWFPNSGFEKLKEFGI